MISDISIPPPPPFDFTGGGAFPARPGFKVVAFPGLPGVLLGLLG